MNLISKKKLTYSVSDSLLHYLDKYGRAVSLPIQYAELSRYENSIPLYDRNGKDTLWETVFFTQSEQDEINEALTSIYAILKSEGDKSVMKHLYVDRIDLCVYGNTLPFRIRIVNKLNDNFDYFYIKKADASRIYGLEWEHILSPNRISFLVDKETLIEEHIVGIPADQFLNQKIMFGDIENHIDEVRIAKEFVKFNERCFIRLLGDMHSSNFVIDVTPDFEETHYRMRAIDFDQQSFEFNKKVYMPQFFKQNLKFVELVSKNLTPESVKQYQKEERSMIASRIRNSKYQVKELLDVMILDEIAPKTNIDSLKKELADHYDYLPFHKAKSMGDIFKTSLKMLVKRKSN